MPGADDTTGDLRSISLDARYGTSALPASLRVRVVVQHKAFTYLIAWLGLTQVATLEPKPGVEPTVATVSSAHWNANQASTPSLSASPICSEELSWRSIS